MGLVRFFLEYDSHNKPSHNRGAEVNAVPRKDYASNLQLPLGRLRLAVRQVVNYEVPLPHTGIPLQSARGRRAILSCPIGLSRILPGNLRLLMMLRWPKACGGLLTKRKASPLSPPWRVGNYWHSCLFPRVRETKSIGKTDFLYHQFFFLFSPP